MWSLPCKAMLCNRTVAETEVKNNSKMAYCIVPENVHAMSVAQIFGAALSPMPTSVPLNIMFLFALIIPSF